MPRCRRGVAAAVLLLTVLSLLSLAEPAGAREQPVILAERAAADTVLVRAEDVVDEDLYAGGNRVLIEGTVRGDLIVAAFQSLEISGTVEGDVVGYSPLVRVTGNVGGSLRVAADVIRVSGTVGVDVFTGARSTVVTGTVGRDVQAWTGTLDLRGAIGRDVLGWVLTRARLGGTVARDVEITVRNLEVMAGTRVEGSLGYRSDREADIAENVEVGRVLTRRDPVTPNVRVKAIFTLTWVLVFLAIAALGFLLFWLAPRTLQRAVEAVRTRTLLSIFVGVGMLLVPVTLMVVIVVRVVDSSPELALPSIVIGIPIGLLVLGMLLFGLLVSPVPVLTGLGQRITGRSRSALFGYLIGLLLWGLVLLVPAVRVFVTALVAVLGLGGWTLGLVAARGDYQWALRTGGKHRRPPAAVPTGALEPEAGEWPAEEIGVPFDAEMLQLPFGEEEEPS